MEEKILMEQQRTNELLEAIINQKKDPNELLTVEQIHEEFDIGTNMVRKMFNDKTLPVQRYTKPFKVTRQAFCEYLGKAHDYLRKGADTND